MEEQLEEQVDPSTLPVIYYDSVGHSQVTSRLLTGAALLQQLATYCKTVGFVQQIDIQGLTAFLNAPNVFIYDQTQSDSPQANRSAFVINKEKYMEILDKPDWYDPLIKKVDTVNEYLLSNGALSQERYLPQRAAALPNYYQVSGEGNIEVLPEILDQLKAKFEERVTSEKGLRAYEFANRFLDLANEFKILEISNGAGMNFEDFLHNLIPFSLITKDMQIDTKFLRLFNRPINR